MLAKQSERAVDPQSVEEYLKQNGNMAHFETSAKEDINIKPAFLEVVKQSLKNIAKEEMFIPAISIGADRARLQPKKQNGLCC